MADLGAGGPIVLVLVRYFAAARAAAGTPEEQFELPGAATVADVLAAAVDRHGNALRTVLQRCSFLLDGVAVRSTGRTVDHGTVLDVLPPFAGG
jgi:molybdopterin converting factor small subunit